MSRRRSNSPEEMALEYLRDEGLTLATERIVCPNCDGNGAYVNPAIDEHGISPDQFHEDPDFAHSYFRGDYDMTCEVCHGRNVIDDIDRERSDLDALAAYDGYLRDYYESEDISRQERMMGA